MAWIPLWQPTMPEHWGFKKQKLPVETGPRGHKRKPRWPVFTGTKEEWEQAFNRTQKARYLFEMFPDPEHEAKWHNLPQPDYSQRGQPGGHFGRCMIWHSRCLPFLARLRIVFRGREGELIPHYEIVREYRKHHPKYGVNFITGTLNQLWKGGRLRRFVRHNRFAMKLDKSARRGGYTGGIHYGVHYQIEPWK